MKANKDKILFFIFSFLITAGHLHAQMELKKKLDSCKSEIKKHVVGYLKSDARTIKYLNVIASGRFVCVPYFELDGSRVGENHDGFDLIKVRRDTSHFSYLLDVINDSFFVIPWNIPGGGLSPIFNVDFTMKEPFFQMIQYARKYSQDCFALKIRYHTRLEKGFLVVCYIEKNKLTVLGFNGWDKDFKIKIGKYDGIDNYIDDNYISARQYHMEFENDSLEHATYLSDVYRSRTLLRNSYYYYEKSSGADTSKGLQMFLKEIDSFAHLSRNQQKVLKNEMASNLWLCDKAGSNNIEFFDRNVSKILSKVLTDEQISDLKEKYFIRLKSECLAFNRLINAYSIWDFGTDWGVKEQVDTGIGKFDPSNPLHKRALYYIFSNAPPNYTD